MKKRDLIIVGQGLAGSILALELMSHGKNVLVIDNSSLSHCSRIAGGIYNPIVFKRLLQSWMAEAALPIMFDFFRVAEKLFGTDLIHETKIARVLGNEDEELLWKRKSLNELSEFLEKEIHAQANEYSFLKNKYAFVKQGGFVDVLAFLTQTKNYLEKNNSSLNETFDNSALSFTNENVLYKNTQAGKIIFCEGHLAVKNPLFSKIKFKPAKGEVLTIYCEGLTINSVLNKDIFILPLAEKHTFKVGATYNWEDLSDTPTDTAKDSLKEKLKALIPYPYKIVAHEAGVRPATIDRRPAIGFLPHNKNIGIFNGFGTKSVMLAPYFAKHFCSFIENKTSLWSEVDINRF